MLYVNMFSSTDLAEIMTAIEEKQNGKDKIQVVVRPELAPDVRTQCQVRKNSQPDWQFVTVIAPKGKKPDTTATTSKMPEWIFDLSDTPLTETWETVRVIQDYKKETKKSLYVIVSVGYIDQLKRWAVEANKKFAPNWQYVTFVEMPTLLDLVNKDGVSFLSLEELKTLVDDLKEKGWTLECFENTGHELDSCGFSSKSMPDIGEFVTETKTIKLTYL